MRYAIINSSNIVTGVALWDGVSAWTPAPYQPVDASGVPIPGAEPTPQTLVADTDPPTANVGSTYDATTNTFTASTTVAATVVPASVFLWQAKAALQSTAFSPSQAVSTYQPALTGATTLLMAANDLIPLLNNAALTQFWSSGDTQIQPTDPYIQQIAAILGLTQDQVNTLFISASKLTV